MRLLLLFVVVLLSGCGRQLDQLLELLAGHKSQTVVLAPGPLAIGPAELSLTAAEPMRVVGETAGVCVVLKSGVSLAPQSVMDKVFLESLKGASLTVSFAMQGGRKFTLPATAQDWNKYGVVAPEELSACSSCACCNGGCTGLFPLGAQVAEVSIKSSAPLTALGVYWYSTNAFDQIK